MRAGCARDIGERSGHGRGGLQTERGVVLSPHGHACVRIFDRGIISATAAAIRLPGHKYVAAGVHGNGGGPVKAIRPPVLAVCPKRNSSPGPRLPGQYYQPAPKHRSCHQSAPTKVRILTPTIVTLFCQILSPYSKHTKPT